MIRGAAALACLLLTAPALAVLTPQQARGKVVYRRGEGTGAIRAVTTADGFELTGSVMPCANCHGYDGRGRAEGGVQPADISAPSLHRTSSGTRSGGRTRPAYTPALLKRAIALGTDPARHTLNIAMPRYRMSIADMDDLLAYLAILGSEKDPGLTTDAITIGVVARGESVRAPLDEVARRVNEDGLFGRKLAFRYAAAAKDLAGEPFALIDTTATADATLALAEQREIPAIGTATAGIPPEGRYAFTLHGGLPELAQALLAQARRSGAAGGLLIVHDATTAALAASLSTDGWSDVAAIDSASGDDVLDAKLAGRTAVLFLGGSAQVGRIVAHAARLPSPPFVLVPASLAVPDLLAAPATLDRRIILAFPLLPAEDASSQAAMRSAAILLDVLQKLGRDVTRERVVDALEKLYHFETGFGPAVTWSPTRRHGSDAVYLMTADLKAKRLIATPGWSD